MADHTSNAPDSVSASAIPGVAEVPSGTAGDKPEPKAGVREIGGRGGLEPTRYGDWEKNGRCIDF
jgi:hypothetical protein